MFKKLFSVFLIFSIFFTAFMPLGVEASPMVLPVYDALLKSVCAAMGTSGYLQNGTRVTQSEYDAIMARMYGNSLYNTNEESYDVFNAEFYAALDAHINSGGTIDTFEFVIPDTYINNLKINDMAEVIADELGKYLIDRNNIVDILPNQQFLAAYDNVFVFYTLNEEFSLDNAEGAFQYSRDAFSGLLGLAEPDSYDGNICAYTDFTQFNEEDYFCTVAEIQFYDTVTNSWVNRTNNSEREYVQIMLNQMYWGDEYESYFEVWPSGSGFLNQSPRVISAFYNAFGIDASSLGNDIVFTKPDFINISAVSRDTHHYYDSNITAIKYDTADLFNDPLLLTDGVSANPIDNTEWVDKILAAIEASKVFIASKSDDILLNLTDTKDFIALGFEESIIDTQASIDTAVDTATGAITGVQTGIDTLIDTLTGTITGTLTDIKTAVLDFTAPPSKTLDLDKFKSISALLFTKFPFSIPFDYYYLMQMLTAAPVAPVFNIDFDISSLGGTKIPLVFDLTQFDSYADKIRSFAMLGFVFFMACATKTLVWK